MVDIITRTLEEAISIITSVTKDHAYESLSPYRVIFQEIRQFAADDTGSEETMVERFYESRFGVPAFTHPETTFRDRIKAGIVINIHRIMTGGDFAKRPSYCDMRESRHWWEDLLKEIGIWLADEKNLEEETIRNVLQMIVLFFRYLEERGFSSLACLTCDDFTDHLLWMQEQKYRRATIETSLYALRRLAEYPEVAERLPRNINAVLSMVKVRHDRIPSVYSEDEIRKVIASIDRSTKSGKLIYAIILLGAVYGMRGVDIRHLKLDDIKWEAGVISFIQHKTRRRLELPLVDEVRYAILDYIANVRHDSKIPQVFIHIKSPYDSFLKTSLSTYVKQQFIKAGIDIGDRHCGTHSLRHSLATLLHCKETPITDIASVLGHSTVQSTMTYVWSDVFHLRLATMEVPGYDG